MSKLDRTGYIAGIFDGEGCVSVQRTTTKYNTVCYSLTVSVSMTDIGPINVIKETFPARYYIHSRRSSSGRELHVWEASGIVAVEFLRTILPYIIGKKDQIEIAIKYGEKFCDAANPRRRRTVEEKQEQEDSYKQLQVLKRINNVKV